MSQPQSYVLGGHYTSNGVSQQIVLPGKPDYMYIKDTTRWGDASANNVAFEWRNYMADFQWHGLTQTAGTNALDSVAGATDGFTFIDTSNPPTFAPLNITTSISAAATAVVTLAATTNIAAGDVVRITGTTGIPGPVGMLQIGGYDFTVGTVNAGVNFQLAYLNSSGFAAPATGGWVRKIIPNRMYPRWRYITGITQANPCVCTVSVAHDFTVGENVSFRVPSQFGMTQLNNVVATVTAVGAGTITLGNVNSTAYTAFAFPTSAIAAAGVSPAVVLPSSSGIIPVITPYSVTYFDAFDNRNVFVMNLGPSVVGVVSSRMEWEAKKYDLYDGS